MEVWICLDDSQGTVESVFKYKKDAVKFKKEYGDNIYLLNMKVDDGKSKS